MTLQDRINEALSPLIGLQLWRARRVMNMEMFEFGARYTRLNRKGEEIDVGDFALHIQCPWRIVGPDGIVVGSEDRHFPEDESSNWQEFDEDGPTLCEARMTSWIAEHGASPLVVQRVEADSIGSFRLFLHRGFVLESLPANSLRGEYSERWRLIHTPQGAPSFSEGTDHFVVTGYGVED
jgi:hypothetical protein